MEVPYGPNLAFVLDTTKKLVRLKITTKKMIPDVRVFDRDSWTAAGRRWDLLSPRAAARSVISTKRSQRASKIKIVVFAPRHARCA